MPLHIKSKNKIARGWITLPEMDFVLSYMKKDTGEIFESGSANGRLFSYLHGYKPNWKYTGLDVWDEKTWLLHNYEIPYHQKGNDSTMITKEMFVRNCPYADAIQDDILDWKTTKKFDVVSIGAVQSRHWSKDTWADVLELHLNMTKKDGVVIGRNYSSTKPGIAVIRDIIAENYVLREDYVEDLRIKHNLPSVGDKDERYSEYHVHGSFAFQRK